MVCSPRVCSFALAAFAVLLAARPSTAAGPGSDPGPPLRIAMSGAFQPFSTTDASGALVGFDADAARELATRMGRTPELVQVDWAGIQAALQAKKVDLICGSMAITDARREEMDFSVPYYVSGAQVFSAGGTRALAGKRLAVTEDSTYARYVDEHPAAFPDVEVTRFGSEAEIVAALSTDKVDAFISDRIVGGFYVQRGGAVGIEPAGELLYEEACGIAARKGEAELVQAANLALFAMVQDGTYADIYRRWVGIDADLDRLMRSWGPELPFVPRTADATAVGALPASEDTRAGPDFVSDVDEVLALLGEGALLTLLLTLVTAVLALLLGVLVGVGSSSPRKAVSSTALTLVWLVRGTPLLVQLFLAYFGLATLLNHAAGFELMGALGAALFALVVNTTAYNAETVRGGIHSVDAGQWDAAFALGMTRARALRRIVIPQALRHALPGLGNNLVVLVKDTSLVGAITLIELTYAARNIVFQTGRAFLPFVAAAGFYLVIITSIPVLVRRAEARLAGGAR